MTETIDTANLRALAEAATPGPWIHYPEDNIIVAEGQEHATLIDVCARSLHVPPAQRDANAALIAAANPATIIALLDRLAAAEARNATLTDEAARNLADAVRYRVLRRGQHWDVINGIGDSLRAEALDEAVDARAAVMKEKTP